MPSSPLAPTFINAVLAKRLCLTMDIGGCCFMLSAEGFVGPRKDRNVCFADSLKHRKSIIGSSGQGCIAVGCAHSE